MGSCRHLWLESSNRQACIGLTHATHPCQGIVNLERLLHRKLNSVIQWRHAKECFRVSLQRLPLPAGNYRLCCLVLLSLPLSFRDVEELMAERGIVLTNETIRQ